MTEHACSSCDSTFRDPSELVSHWRSVHGVLGQRCLHCGRSYLDARLTRLVESIDKERRVVCDGCLAQHYPKENHV